MGTEMTPIASQEPSRTATPIRATTPATRSPIHSGTSTPMRGQNGLETVEGQQGSLPSRGNGTTRQCLEGSSPCKMSEKNNEDQARKLSPLESRAMAWDEAERAKYMARFKREEVKIQAWENHQIRKAEMEMKKMEVKAERMKALAQERFSNKLAATKRIAEERRANAQIKMKDKALKTTERVEYIRRTGHVPSLFSFNFKLPSICW
ncbi:Remorin, C-terminal [Sesbania bispinosa]|nr:Remorin, C-terminal [Sesbania bispinosa]